jgi:hypothetical protein
VETLRSLQRRAVQVDLFFLRFSFLRKGEKEERRSWEQQERSHLSHTCFNPLRTPLPPLQLERLPLQSFISFSSSFNRFLFFSSLYSLSSPFHLFNLLLALPRMSTKTALHLPPLSSPSFLLSSHLSALALGASFVLVPLAIGRVGLNRRGEERKRGKEGEKGWEASGGTVEKEEGEGTTTMKRRMVVAVRLLPRERVFKRPC